MKFRLILFWTFVLFICFGASGQVSILTWNLQNLGASKSDDTVKFIAETIAPYDVVALQEVVAGPNGAKAVARLSAELNRTGAQWNYIISDPTQGEPNHAERYAFLYKTNRLKLIGKPQLEKHFAAQIQREPFIATFEFKGKQFTLVNFHALPKKKQPETEIKYFKFFARHYPDKHLVFVGDFNCIPKHSVFNPIRSQGYIPAFENQKTTLKNECKQDQCLANAYDNIWFDSAKAGLTESLVIHFYNTFDSMKLARKISDHIPIIAVLNLF